MLNGNGALDTATHRLVHLVRDELSSRRWDALSSDPSEAPTQELSGHRFGARSPARRSDRPPGRIHRYPQV